MRRLELTEYRTCTFAREELSEATGEAIYRRWGGKVEIDFPSPKTDQQWRIKPTGWVGFLPVSKELGLDIRPKVPISNLLRMFEFAYGLRSIEFHEEVAGCTTIADFYSRLAALLSRRVLLRARRGLFRGYVGVSDDVAAIRGRVDIRSHVAAPWESRVPCHFEEHTPDLVENQILAWTLSRIIQNVSLADAARPVVRSAYRAVRAAATPRPFLARDCVDRLYNRLNTDYEPLHLLCRFFLEHTGPTMTDGEKSTVPFVVNVARLFELFVAEWLQAHLPSRFVLRWQDRASLGTDDLLQFNIDMVLYDREEHRDIAVIDAKYKLPDHPSTEDVAQVTLYAQLRNCRDAILIYPSRPAKPVDATTSHHRIRTLWFGLEGDLETQGKTLCSMLLEGRAADDNRPVCDRSARSSSEGMV